jgi:hypothetical protein
VRLSDDGCQQPKHVAVDLCHVYIYWYVQVGGLMNLKNLGNLILYFFIHSAY